MGGSIPPLRMKSLFILPFDHRNSFARDVLGAAYPVDKTQKAQLTKYKQVIFDGFLAARKRYQGDATLGVLVDEEFGAPILTKAKKLGIPFAVTTESPTHEPFDFVWKDFRKTLAKWQPTWAKALAYYTVGNDTMNVDTRKKLRLLSDFCVEHGIGFMLEVLVKGDGLKRALMERMIDEMNEDGVAPALWKLEGLDHPEDWVSLAKHANAPLIVLGRGESPLQVDAWLAAAAKSGKTVGIAVGRTVFLAPIQELHNGTINRAKAVDRIAKNYLHYIGVWERTRSL